MIHLFQSVSRPFYSLVALTLFSTLFLPKYSNSQTTNRSSQSVTDGAAFPRKFEPRKPSQYELGFHVGLPIITGDVSPRAGYGGGLSLRKAINHYFSIRGEYTRAMHYGLDYRTSIPNQLPRNRTQDPWLIYYLDGNKDFVANYKTGLHQFSLQGVLAVNPYSAHRGNPKASVYFFGGYSLLLAKVNVDALDDKGVPYVINDQSSPVNFGEGTRREIRSQLKQMMNLDYESNAGVLNGKRAPIGLPNNVMMRHSLNGGMGYAVKLTDRFNVAFEHRITYAFSDELDGIYKGRTNDVLHFSSLRLNINLGKSGKKSQPLWWINPYRASRVDTVIIKDETYKATKDTLVMITKDTLVIMRKDTVFMYKQDSIYRLNNINYDFDKATLRPESKRELNNLVNILNKYPTMVIELRSHTDSKGTPEYNIDLSKRRAKACTDYLISQGIAPSRLISNGYGETMPIEPNTKAGGMDNPDGRAENRRTEFKVIKQ